MYRLRLAICLGVAIAWFSGCNPPAYNAAPHTAKVKGAVNIDGKPMPEGELHFGMPGIPPSILIIKDGTFSGDAPVGKNKVEAFIWVVGAAATKYADTQNKTNTVPQKYWGPNTILEASVTTEGPNEFKFDITATHETESTGKDAKRGKYGR